MRSPRRSPSPGRTLAITTAAVLTFTTLTTPTSAASTNDSQWQEPHSVDLADSKPPSEVYRIPAMTVSEGTVVAAYDKRNDGAGDLPGDIDVVVRRSTDSGATWSEPEVVVDHPAPQGCGDPSLLTDETSGRVFLFCTYSAGNVGFADSQPGTNDPRDPDTLHLRVRHSDDQGKTWSEPTYLNPQVKKKSWRGVFLSSGHGIQTSRGRLLQPIVVKDKAGNVHAANIYSDDHGRTWQRGELIEAGTNENKAVELSDGTVRQNMRPGSGDHRLVAESTDGGHSFGAPQPAEELIDPQVNGDVIRVDEGTDGPRRDWLLFSNPASTSARENLTIRLSCDNGRSWPVERRLHEGPSGYSTMAMLPNGEVGILAETGRDETYEHITFYALPVEDVGTCTAKQ